jgi:hypothetical protein
MLDVAELPCNDSDETRISLTYKYTQGQSRERNICIKNANFNAFQPYI